MKTTLLFPGKFLILPLIAILFPLLTFAQWSAPENISPNAMNAALNESMGACMVASHDTIHVIWSDKRTLGSAIYYTRSIDTGHTWSTAVAITDTMGKASFPSIAVNGRNIHISWYDSLNEKTNFGNSSLSGNSSFYIHSTDGGNTWARQVCIDSNTIFWGNVAVSGSTVIYTLSKGVFDSTYLTLAISSDNGNTWGPEQKVSTRNGYGRSEDPATVTDGKYIHLSWNDNRCDEAALDTMQIYYRRSTDMGLTWEPETALTNCNHNSYTTMVCLDSGHVDIAHGEFGNGWIIQSSDSGTTWSPDEYVISDGEYPSLVRNGENLHLVHPSGDSIMYVHSGNGGATWDPKVFIATTCKCWYVPFIALSCPVLSIIWPDNGTIYYVRNPTGNPSCSSSPNGITNVNTAMNAITLYPNPAKNYVTITFPEAGTRQIDIYDITGRIITGFESTGSEYQFPCDDLSPGMYFIRVSSGKNTQVMKFIKR
ncbi:MAG: T9SS type A sorting domain-containing protein [Bacteroidia bacterium]